MSGDGLLRGKARRLAAAGDQQPERISKFSGAEQERRTNARKLGSPWQEAGHSLPILVA
jgi:hypothetical protein